VPHAALQSRIPVNSWHYSSIALYKHRLASSLSTPRLCHMVPVSNCMSRYVVFGDTVGPTNTVSPRLALQPLPVQSTSIEIQHNRLLQHMGLWQMLREHCSWRWLLGCGGLCLLSVNPIGMVFEPKKEQEKCMQHGMLLHGSCSP